MTCSPFITAEKFYKTLLGLSIADSTVMSNTALTECHLQLHCLQLLEVQANMEEMMETMCSVCFSVSGV